MGKNSHIKWIFGLALIVINITITGCSNHSTKAASATIKSSAHNSTNIKKAPTEPISIVSTNLKQANDQIDVDVKMKNTSQSAEPIKTDSFVLIFNNQAFSPNSKTSIPVQIPANSTIDLTLEFDNKGINGSENVKLGFQPSDPKKAQLFTNLGTIVFKKVTETETPIKKATQTNSASAIATQSSIPANQTSTQTTNNNSIELKQTSGDGGTVLVPVGWIRSSYDGGDYSGYQYINPKDPNQKMLVVASTCVGCYYPNADSTQKPDPKSVIPETNLQSTFIFGNGYDVAYSYYQNGNPYLGNGVLKITPKDGYGFAEITLPDSEKSIATKILNSYKF